MIARNFFRIAVLFAALFPMLNALGSDSTLSICTETGLRTAFQSGGVIQLRCDNNFTNFTLTQPIVVTRDTSLIATQEVLITGSSQTRLFVVQPGVSFRMENITLFSGRQSPTNANNGGVPDTAGGGVYNNGGHLFIYKGHFENHSVLGVAGADGASGNEGEDAEAGGDAAGGAIFNNAGDVTISNTVFIANSVTAGIGGRGGDGGEGLGGDGGRGGNGGSAGGAAIYSQGGSVALFNCVFTNNVATGSLAGEGGAGTGALGFNGVAGEPGDGVGGAVGGNNAVITIYGCTFVDNSVQGADGANGKDGLRNLSGDPGRDGGEAAGGAIYSTGSLAITNSTFFLNTALSGNGGKGGQGGSGSFGGDGGRGGNGGLASGGAVESLASVTIIHSTFSDSQVTGGAGGTGGQGAGALGRSGDNGSVGAVRGAAVNQAAGQLSVANSIFNNSSTGSIAGLLQDLGGNIASDTNSLLNVNISFPNTSPALQTLANNGGPTPTMAIGTNSPAWNKGVAQFCLSVDQRGTNRLQQCDIGAFELTIVTNSGNPIIPTNVLHLIASSSLTNQNLSLLWPAGYTNLFLQYNTNLVKTNWATVTNQFASHGTNNLFVISTATNRSQLYFRLQGMTNNPAVDTNILPPFPR
jgi:hypothetical protein